MFLENEDQDDTTGGADPVVPADSTDEGTATPVDDDADGVKVDEAPVA